MVHGGKGKKKTYYKHTSISRVDYLLDGVDGGVYDSTLSRNYQLLACSIILQAFNDYKSALRSAFVFKSTKSTKLARDKATALYNDFTVKTVMVDTVNGPVKLGAFLYDLIEMMLGDTTGKDLCSIAEEQVFGNPIDHTFPLDCLVFKT